jgi:hypothetical protein
MKVIIAGSRNITNPKYIDLAIEESGFRITEVVCGGARGIDTLGEEWATWNGILVARFNALWDIHGKVAGFKRNVQMAEYADALIAINSGTNGTQHMIDTAKHYGLEVYVLDVLLLKGDNINEKGNTNNRWWDSSNSSDSEGEGTRILDPCF